MITCLRTNSDSKDFQSLVKELDADLRIRDGAEHGFYAQYNKIDSIKYVVVAYKGNGALGCGAIKHYDTETMEVKRMFVSPAHRSKGIATTILIELETWAAELSYGKCILETGRRQHEAIRLYRKNGYTEVPNFSQYAGRENSICFEKLLF
jgi:putative acetyltransferase